MDRLRDRLSFGPYEGKTIQDVIDINFNYIKECQVAGVLTLDDPSNLYLKNKVLEIRDSFTEGVEG